MSAARLSPVFDADFEEIGDQRRTDRRAGDRRALRLKLDPLFAATLVNHIAAGERVRATSYAPPVRRLAGIAVNLRA